MNFADIHCHALPCIDDGSPNIETTLIMLEDNLRQGIDGVVFTPHYYSDCSISDFIEKRNTSAAELHRELKKLGRHLGISCLCGAEVYYKPSLLEEEDIKDLCIGGTNYLLLEMPFAKWEASSLRNINILINSFGLTPVIAHIERYLPYNEKDVIKSLLNMNICVQMNAGFLLNRKTTKKAKALIKDGIIDFLASDCHNTESRPQNLEAALNILYDSGMSFYADSFVSNSKIFFK